MSDSIPRTDVIIRTLVRSLIILFVAALLAAAMYVLAASSYAPELTRALNVPRDRNVGLLAGPLSAIGIDLYSPPPLPIRNATVRGRDNIYVQQGLTDVAKNLLALAFLIALVALIRAVAQRFSRHPAPHAAHTGTSSALPRNPK